MYYRYNKFKNTKTEVNGIVFDSKKEASRYLELLQLEKAGAITELDRQVVFELIPNIYENGAEITRGKNKGTFKKVLVERRCTYVADFVYNQDGRVVVEDVKGIRTEVYKIKKKMMLDKYGIKIKEV